MIWKKNLFENFFIDNSNSRKNCVLVFSEKKVSMRIGDDGLVFMAKILDVDGVDLT